MKTKNTAFYSLRLNLDNKQHREVFEILQSLDKTSLSQEISSLLTVLMNEYGAGVRRPV